MSLGLWDEKSFSDIEMNRRDKIVIKHDWYVEADVEIDWGKAICIKYKDVAKPQWIPKSAITILEKKVIEKNEYQEKSFYIVKVADWYKLKNEWYYKFNRDSRKP